MAIRVTNNLHVKISLPSPVDDNLKVRETKTYQYVEYDKYVNDPRVAELLRKEYIAITNLDAADSVYVSQWNVEPKLRLGTYVFWVDALNQLRMKNGDPVNDLDGVVIGPGGGLAPHGATHEFTGTDPVPNIEILEELWNCPAGTAVRDVVYQSGSGAVDQANATSSATMPALGFVMVKPTPTTCIIARSGEVPGFALVADSSYYVSTIAGVITVTPPSGTNNVVQRVGYSKTATSLIVELGETRRRA